MEYQAELENLIKRSHEALTDKEFVGWKGNVISFVKDNHPDKESQIRTICDKSKEKHEILADARRFLQNL